MSYNIKSDLTWHRTITDLGDCFSKWGVRVWAAEPNTTQNRVNSRGYNKVENAVTVTFTKKDRPVVLSLDTQDTPAKNLRALFLCIDGMRMMDVRGVGQIAQNAYRQLAGPSEPVKRDPYEVLGVRPDAPMEVIEASYKVLAKRAHPDIGGTNDAMAELNEAFEDVKARSA